MAHLLTFCPLLIAGDELKAERATNDNGGIDLDEIKEFAKVFKLRRLSMGLTQSQVGHTMAAAAAESTSYSQSAICR